MSGRILVAACWLACSWIYLVSMPGTFYFEDGPELLACAACLGNTHPPGYPLLSLAGRLALVLPAGCPAFRFNLLIAACAAGAAVVWGCLVARLAASAGVSGSGEARWPAVAAGAGVSRSGETRWPAVAAGAGVSRSGETRWPAVAAGAFAGGAWALSDAFWWQASIGDKYGPYYLAFAAVLSVSVGAMQAGFPGLGRAAARLGFVTGAAFAHHQFAIFALPAVACAAGRMGLMRALGARIPAARSCAVAAVLVLLPVSTKFMYPPIRSAGGAVHDWGGPGRAASLRTYLGGELYRGGFASTSIPRNPSLAAGRWRLAARFLFEEIPWPLLLAAPAGALLLARASPLAAAAGALCLAGNAAWCMNFSEKVVRWYEPAYAVLLAAAGVGWAWALVSLRGAARGMALAALVAVPLVWQGARGASRNDLSRFYAAHDLARATLMALPPGAVYLGAGDFDLFPVWAAQGLEGARPDVGAAGLGGFVDPAHTASGAEDRVLAAAGIDRRGVEGLAALLALPGAPRVWVAASGNDRKLQEVMPFLRATEIHGLAGRIVRSWAPAAGAAASRRLSRAWSLRNLRHGPAGAIRDLVRLRDEVARGALLQYPACLATLGQQCVRFGLDADAAWAFAAARGGIEALVGPVEPPPAAGWLPPLMARARRDRQAVALGYGRLADVLLERGVTFLADQVRGNAAAVLQ